MLNPDPEFLYSDPQNRIQWRCKYCPKIYLESGGTHAIVTHLEGHDIRESLSKDSKASQVQTLIQHTLEQQRSTSIHDDIFNLLLIEINSSNYMSVGLHVA